VIEGEIRRNPAHTCGAQALQDAAAGGAFVCTGRDNCPCVALHQDARAGNDFVVLDGTRTPIDLTPEQARRLGDRRWASVPTRSWSSKRAPRRASISVIASSTRARRVEQCGNGARCFSLRSRQGLSEKTTIRVETVNNLLELRLQPMGAHGDMNRPIFELDRVPFDASG